MSGGYGHFNFKGLNMGAYRWSYLLKHGGLVSGSHIDHLCRNRLCVNPAHLEEVDRSTNILRGHVYNSQKTHCSNGHAFDESNTNHCIGSNGRPARSCRACKRIRNSGRMR